MWTPTLRLLFISAPRALGALVPSRVSCAGVAFYLDGKWFRPSRKPPVLPLFCMGPSIGCDRPLVRPVGLAFSPRELGGRVLMCPKGTDITLVCTEKQVKIFIPTLWLGGISLRLTTIFKKNKLIFVSLVILSGVIFFFFCWVIVCLGSLFFYFKRQFTLSSKKVKGEPDNA